VNNRLFPTVQLDGNRDATRIYPACLPAGDIMRRTLIALALAATSLIATSIGHAGTAYSDSYYGHYQQNCITKRIRTIDADGRAVTKRVRICR
jgi:hypothetical protein